jgi:hypothetical protein
MTTTTPTLGDLALAPSPYRYAGFPVYVVDAQLQARTPRDVPGSKWHHPRVPSKAAGRRGTRRGWRRRHPSAREMLYREPDDALIVADSFVVLTRDQLDALLRWSMCVEKT